VQQDWNSFQPQWKLPRCLVADIQCEAIVTDLDDDGQPEVLLFNLPTGAAAAFKKGAADQSWSYLGIVANANCAGVRDALRAGNFEITQPTLKEIAVNNQRLRVTPECTPAPTGR
jgi:hypothetical protein